MGFIDILRGVIEAFRAAGKTEQEITDIIEQASEKATVKPAVRSYNQFPKTDRETNNWRKLHGLPMRRKARGVKSVWKRKKNRQL